MCRLKQAIEHLESICRSKEKMIEERAHDLTEIPYERSFLRRFIRECIDYLDYSEACCVLLKSDFKENKKYVVRQIEEVLQKRDENEKSDLLSKMLGTLFDGEIDTRIEANFAFLEVLKEHVNEGTQAEFWEQHFQRKE